MLTYVVKRLGEGVITLLLMTMLIFGLTRFTGDPTLTMLPMTATQEDRALLSARMGLDKPLVEQYWIFLKSAVRGDFGMSIMAPGRSCMELVGSYG